MSGIYILKNVFSFAQILNLAAAENLRKWDESTLKKALNWAQYCEEVYKHVLLQGYDKDISSKITQMSVLMTPPSFLMLNFDCLRTAKKLLVETILTNSKGSSDLKKCLETLVDPCIWSEVSVKIVARPSFNDLDTSLSIFWIQNQNELQAVRNRNASTYAKILLRNMLIVMTASEKEERFQAYIASLFDRLISLESGWGLLLHFFIVSPGSFPSDLESGTESLLSFLLSWMYHKLNGLTKCPILKLDIEALGQASVNSFGFLNFYLSSLEKWGQCFQPCIDGLGKESMWRDSNDGEAHHLTKHFRHLLLNDCACRDTGQSIKSQVLIVLTRNINNSDFTVWRTVATALLKVN